MIEKINNNLNFIKPVFDNARLISAISKRDIAVRYKNSFFGVLWSFVHPLFMLTIYTFVFEYVFKAKWGSKQDLTASFSVILFSGLIVHMLFSEVLIRSSSIIINNSNYVKKIIFPLETLCWSLLLTAIVQFLCGLVILFFFLAVIGWEVNASVFLIPIVLLSMVVMLVGLSFIISSLTVFIRDLEQIVQVLATIILFTSTVFFPLERVPDFLVSVIKLNPITIPIETLRALIFFNEKLNIYDFSIYSAVSVVVACLGFWVFKFLKVSFSDVL